MLKVIWRAARSDSSSSIDMPDPNPNNADHITRRESLRRIGAALTLPSQLSGEVAQAGLEALAGPSLSPAQRFTRLFGDMTQTIKRNARVGNRIEAMLLYSCGDRGPITWYNDPAVQRWITQYFSEGQQALPKNEVLNLAQDTLNTAERDIRSAACIAQEIRNMPEVGPLYRSAIESHTNELDSVHGVLHECADEMLSYSHLVSDSASTRDDLLGLSDDIRWLSSNFTDLSISERTGVLNTLKGKLENLNWAYRCVLGSEIKKINFFSDKNLEGFYYRCSRTAMPSTTPTTLLDGLKALGISDDNARSGAQFLSPTSDYTFQLNPVRSWGSEVSRLPLEKMIEDRVFDRTYLPLVDNVNGALRNIKLQSADAFKIIESGTSSSSEQSSEQASQPEEDDDFEPSELQEWYSQLLTTPFRR